jgi:cytoskeletal protein RodZ
MAQRRRSSGSAPSGSADFIREIEPVEPSEEAKAHEPSHVDAMGHDKRRQVVGHSYGPSRRSQMIFFGIVGAAVVVILGGWTLAVAAFDTAPENYPDKAPWSTASQQSPTRSPSGPCGEPGNAYPPPADSPCAAQTAAKTTEREPSAIGGASGSQEEGSGGAVGGTSESQAAPD